MSITLEGTLFLLVAAFLMLNVPVSLILIHAAWQKPRIVALNVMAVSSTLITLGLTTYVLAVLNVAAGYPVPKEVMQNVLRSVLIGLAAFPLWFLWLYVTRRFEDRETTTETSEDWDAA